MNNLKIQLVKDFNDQLIEIDKISDDVIYFVENYCSGYDGNKIKLLPLQKLALKQMQEEKRLSIRAERQSGKTTINILYALWCLITKDNIKVGIVSNYESLGNYIMPKFYELFDNLPVRLKSKLIAKNKNSIKLSNGSSLDIFNKNSTNNIRGRILDILMFEDFEYINAETYNTFSASTYHSKEAKIFTSESYL